MGYRSVDIERTIKVIEANRSLIRGIKVRASQVITGDLGIECVRLAKKIGKLSKLPLIMGWFCKRLRISLAVFKPIS